MRDARWTGWTARPASPARDCHPIAAPHQSRRLPLSAALTVFQPPGRPFGRKRARQCSVRNAAPSRGTPPWAGSTSHMDGPADSAIVPHNVSVWHAATPTLFVSARSLAVGGTFWGRCRPPTLRFLTRAVLFTNSPHTRAGRSGQRLSDRSLRVRQAVERH